MMLFLLSIHSCWLLAGGNVNIKRRRCVRVCVKPQGSSLTHASFPRLSLSPPPPSCMCIHTHAHTHAMYGTVWCGMYVSGLLLVTLLFVRQEKSRVLTYKRFCHDIFLIISLACAARPPPDNVILLLASPVCVRIRKMYEQVGGLAEDLGKAGGVTRWIFLHWSWP